MNKKIVGLGLTTLLLLTACDSVRENQNLNSDLESANFLKAGNVKIITDTDTGCQYVIIDEGANSAKMSPYYDKNGQVKGCGR